jgi:hypothetical protein
VLTASGMQSEYCDSAFRILRDGYPPTFSVEVPADGSSWERLLVSMAVDGLCSMVKHAGQVVIPMHGTHGLPPAHRGVPDNRVDLAASSALAPDGGSPETGL